MKYQALVTHLSEQTGHARPVIKTILDALPEALLRLDEGDHVRTPLGVFRMSKRNSRDIKLPDGGGLAQVNERLVVRLKPGFRLQQDPSDEPASPEPLSQSPVAPSA